MKSNKQYFAVYNFSFYLKIAINCMIITGLKGITNVGLSNVIIDPLIAGKIIYLYFMNIQIIKLMI